MNAQSVSEISLRPLMKASACASRLSCAGLNAVQHCSHTSSSVLASSEPEAASAAVLDIALACSLSSFLLSLPPAHTLRDFDRSRLQLIYALRQANVFRLSKHSAQSRTSLAHAQLSRTHSYRPAHFLSGPVGCGRQCSSGCLSRRHPTITTCRSP